MRAESRRAQRRDGGGALGTTSRRCIARPPHCASPRRPSSSPPAPTPVRIRLAAKGGESSVESIGRRMRVPAAQSEALSAGSTTVAAAAAVAAALSLSLAVHCQHSAFESRIRCRRVFDRLTDSTRPAPLGHSTRPLAVRAAVERTERIPNSSNLESWKQENKTRTGLKNNTVVDHEAVRL